MKLGFLASHGGSNMQAILDGCQNGLINAEPTLLICNNPNARALERATKAGIPIQVLNGKTHADPTELDRAMQGSLKEAGIELVILAGYMKKIGPITLASFPNRILNIHPALLPKFGGAGMYGIRVHEAVIEAGITESGSTVHLINENMTMAPYYSNPPFQSYPKTAQNRFKLEFLKTSTFCILIP